MNAETLSTFVYYIFKDVDVVVFFFRIFCVGTKWTIPTDECQSIKATALLGIKQTNPQTLNTQTDTQIEGQTNK